MAVNMKVNITCLWCGKVQPLELTRESVERWKNGAKPSEAFAYLSPVQRDLLTTRQCDPCYSVRVKKTGDDR